MPQITVNEIDQSVVTRVVKDDRVKILVPAILSFGPAATDDNTSVMTFTDVSDFNRGCGYTPAEFNPFNNDSKTNDYSRTYARELLKRGSAVSVVRVNQGYAASFNIDGSASQRTNPSYSTICKAAFKGIQKQDYTEVTNESKTIPSGAENDVVLHTDIIPQTVKVTVANTIYYDDGNGSLLSYGNDTALGSIDYETGTITGIPTSTSDRTATAGYKYITNPATTAWKYTFCPQIAGIEAKYTGSFGNNLFISISQIESSRLTESYQYANISVYYIDRNINYEYNETTQKAEIKSQTVNSVTMLETKRVSTNPNDPDYFEDVEFDFIRIDAIPTSREELNLVWSNINGSSVSNQQYSGFPVIPLRFNVQSGVSSYNFAANFDKTYGTDFMYEPETVEKLKAGFKGFIGGTSATWSSSDVNEYIAEVYGNNGIISTIYSNIASVYENFTDPYIYDFDFITSGGFVYTEWEVNEHFRIEVKDQKVAFSGDTINLGHTNIIVDDDASFKLSGKLVDNTPTEFYAKKNDTKIYYKVGSTETDSGATLTVATGIITKNSFGGTFESATYVYESPEHKAQIKYPSAGQYTSITPIHAQMLNLVETRQDCIALFDVPYDYDPKDPLIEYSRMLNTSYGTMHFPWCYVADPDVSGNMLLMAPSYIFLYTFLSNLDNNVDSQKWFPPAGVKRATARVVKKPYFEMGSVLLNIWQNDNTARVNPIMKLKQYGYVIYGQYTCLPAIDMFTHSALESLNVRLISNVVKKKIFDVCLNLAFEPNTETLWLKFYSQMDEFLRYMKYNEGLYEYKIVMDESTVTTDDINHLRCPGKVYIAPTRTAEFFDIDFIITEAGALFNN